MEKTTEQYKKDVYKVNPNIEVNEEYINNHTAIAHICKVCGYGKNGEWKRTPNSILKGRGCPNCRRLNKSFEKRMSHEEYVRRLGITNPDVEVIELYANNKTPIAHRCKICGWGNNGEWKPKPCNLLNGSGCPVCSGHTVGSTPKYKNSVWASEHREYFSKYMTEERMKKCNIGSSHKTLMTCPDCGKNKMIAPSTVLRQGFGCVCGDGISYPNKFIYALLDQLKVAYTFEYTPKWGNNKRYDIYIDNLSCIVENHGLQHYVGWNNRTENLKKQQTIDNEKQRLALNHGIKNYIILDCKESSIEWIKNSIMNSVLPQLLHFTEEDIDWGGCDRYATKNLAKTVCRYYDIHPELNPSDVAKNLHLGYNAVMSYLKKGVKYGWCTYDLSENRKKGAKKVAGAKHSNAMPVYCLEENKVYGYILEVELDFANRGIKIWAQNISKCCLGQQKTVKGYHWYYLYDSIRKNGEVIKGAITLGLITKEEALQQLQQKYS